MLFSCTTNEPTIIQLPDTTAPSGYIVSPLNGSSVSGNTSLQVIAIDNGVREKPSVSTISSP